MFCFSCEHHTIAAKVPLDLDIDMEGDNIVSLPQAKQVDHDLMGDKVGPIKDRNITIDTVKAYKVRLDVNHGIVTKHYYPYMSRDGDIIAYKERVVDNKDFFTHGPIQKAILFGQSEFTKGGKYITICEGEIDTMAAYQMMGSKWPVLGVKSSSEAYKSCKREFEWLDSFENIIIAFDNDDPGKKAAKAVASLFPKKAKLVKLKYNDVGDYLEKHEDDTFVNLWWRAEQYRPDDIISDAATMWDIIKKPRAEAAVLYPWQGLNAKTYGMRTSEMLTLIAGSGSGKTSVAREIAYHTLKTSEYNIGMLFLEDTGWETGRGMISLDLNKPTHLPDVHVTEDELKDGNERTWGTGRLHTLSDSWQDNSVDYICDKIKYFAMGCDCKVIILDHISFMVSDQSGDERKMLDEIAHKLKAATVEYDIHLCMVAHTKRQSGKALEEGGQTSLADIRGTAGIGQLSNIVIGLERDGQAEDPIEANTTTIRVVKNRFCGRTGIATQVHYNEHTGRLTEVDKEMEDET
jgi:twinkle protein